MLSSEAPAGSPLPPRVAVASASNSPTSDSYSWCTPGSSSGATAREDHAETGSAILRDPCYAHPALSTACSISRSLDVVSHIRCGFRIPYDCETTWCVSARRVIGCHTKLGCLVENTMFVSVDPSQRHLPSLFLYSRGTKASLAGWSPAMSCYCTCLFWRIQVHGERGLGHHCRAESEIETPSGDSRSSERAGLVVARKSLLTV